MKHRYLFLCAASAIIAMSQSAVAQTAANGKSRVRQHTGREVVSHNVKSPHRAIVAPDDETFGCMFDEASDMDQFVIIDANGDEKTWKYVADMQWTSCAYNGSMSMDDWLITPMFELEAGRKYTISFGAKSSGTQYPERIEAFLGRDREVASMTIKLIEPTDLSTEENEMMTLGAYFTPEESGQYCLGIHGISDPDMNWLAVDDIRVSSPDAVYFPGEDCIVYGEDELLFSEDFSNVGGSPESPVLLVSGDDCALTGLMGWRGQSVYGIGGGVLVDGISNSDHELVPPPIDLKGNKVIRFEVDASITERNPACADFNGWEYLTGNMMVMSSECPDGWRYSGSAIQGDFPYDDNVTFTATIESEIPVGQKVMMVDNSLTTYSVTDLGEHPVDALSSRLCSGFQSKFKVTGVRMYARKPTLDKPEGLFFSEYEPGKAKVTWNAVEGADNYYVILYRGEYVWGSTFPYKLKKLGVQHVTTTSADIEMDSSEPVFVEVFAVRGETERSMSSDYLKVYGVSPMELTGVEVKDDGFAYISWNPIVEGDMILVQAYAGTKSGQPRDNFVVAEMDFSNLDDKPADDNTPYEMRLDEYAYGWTAVPSIAIEDGAIVGDNFIGSWGGTYTTVSSMPIDFSDINGDITVTMTARTNKAAMIKATINTYDEQKWGVTEAAASEYATLTTEFKTYTFTLPGGYDNAVIQINTGGSDKIYIRDLKVTCDVPADKMVMLPYIDGYIDLAQNPGVAGGACPVHTGAHTDLAFQTQIIRNEVAEGDIVSKVVSPFSNRMYAEHVSAGMEIVAAGTAAEGPAVWYNLQGMRVENPSHGVYIRVAGGISQKVVIR